jgi:hypothetical protein
MSNTPGPWHTSRSEVYVYAKDEHDEPIAEIYAVNGWDQAKADARLIAAAPELLEALKQIRDAEPSEDKTAAEDWRDLRAIARAAIAKATATEEE